MHAILFVFFFILSYQFWQSFTKSLIVIDATVSAYRFWSAQTKTNRFHRWKLYFLLDPRTYCTVWLPPFFCFFLCKIGIKFSTFSTKSTVGWQVGWMCYALVVKPFCSIASSSHNAAALAEVHVSVSHSYWVEYTYIKSCLLTRAPETSRRYV